MIQIHHDKKVAENVLQQPSLDETNAANKYDETKTGGKKSEFSCGQIDVSDPLATCYQDTNNARFSFILSLKILAFETPIPWAGYQYLLDFLNFL